MQNRTCTLAVCLIVGLVVGLMLGLPAAAKDVESTRFADQLMVGPASLKLHGTAVMYYRLIFKPFVAALYLPDGVAADAALADVPKRLEIEYYYTIEAADLASASNKVLADNFPPTKLQPLRPRIDGLHAMYAGVKKGDRYALTYLPGQGTELSLNGKQRGIVPGADFAAAYFAIWLGQKPMDESFKAQLLDKK